MTLRRFWILRKNSFYAAFVLFAAVAVALNGSNARTRGTQKGTEAKAESVASHEADFDYLLGDWEFSGDNHQYGKVHGFWSAARLDAGKQIMDEYRVVGQEGETYYLTTTVRAYNNALKQWELVSMDQGTGLQNIGTGHREGREMHIEQKFAGPNSTTYILRIRYHDIRSDGFSWVADRSSDGGKTWEKDYQRLEVRRIGPPRTLSSLTSATRSIIEH